MVLQLVGDVQVERIIADRAARGLLSRYDFFGKIWTRLQFFAELFLPSPLVGTALATSEALLLGYPAEVRRPAVDYATGTISIGAGDFVNKAANPDIRYRTFDSKGTVFTETELLGYGRQCVGPPVLTGPQRQLHQVLAQQCHQRDACVLHGHHVGLRARPHQQRCRHVGVVCVSRRHLPRHAARHGHAQHRHVSRHGAHASDAHLCAELLLVRGAWEGWWWALTAAQVVERVPPSGLPHHH